MAKKFQEEYPLVCPFCDELAYMKPRARKIVLPHKIYILRECIMGHEFYSVEEVPENQDEILEEIKEIKADATKWKRDIKNLPESR